MINEKAIRDKVSRLEGEAADFIKKRDWKRALKKLEVALNNAEKTGDHEYAKEILSHYASVEQGENPYAPNYISNGFSILALVLGGLFFLSPKLTGNVIGNLTNSTSNLIGGILFVSGLAGIYFINKK